jgi:BASS family bile acid:Na+ symporter
MSLDRVINILVTVMLVEMMVAIGLGVTLSELFGVLRDWRLVMQALFANYVCFPLVTVGLLILLRPAEPAVPVGFLTLAVCPGAPFGPPCTRIAGGNVAAAVGWMVVLAGSSALLAPVLLRILMPLLVTGNSLEVDAVKIVITLLMTQLLPLCLGLALRHRWPSLAERLQKPANGFGSLLSLLTIGVILYAQFSLLAEIRWRGYVGMLTLLVASFVVGWLLGWPGAANRKAMTLTTSLRNVGVGLVIAAANFPNTAAVTAVLAYGILEIFGSLLLAWAWGKRSMLAEAGG